VPAHRGAGASAATTTTTTKATTTAEESPPPTDAAVVSWESLESELEVLRAERGEETKPVLTLYRDTNGWCPFCERVWIAVKAKGLPYQETLVPLQGKPEWYKQMVPTGLVPAVLFHGDENGGEEDAASTSRELVWESDAILRALDEKFPDTPRLMKEDDEEFSAALEMQNKLQVAGFRFAYGDRNGTLTENELRENRDRFEAVLDELDEALGEQQAKAGDDEACFRLGAQFSGIDAIMVPTLERWRYQLPLTDAMDILESRPHLRRWFDSMDSYAPYGARVAGDAYSWTATASMFLRYFGGGEDKPKVAEGIARADAAAEDLSGGFASALGGVVADDNSGDVALEAAAKLVSNHEAVLADCLREEPLSQQHIPRASPDAGETTDALLRHVTSVLLRIASTEPLSGSSLSLSDNFLALENIASVVEGATDGATQQGAMALETVSKRLCVPRDMGAPSAALLRGILCTVANGLRAEE